MDRRNQTNYLAPRAASISTPASAADATLVRRGRAPTDGGAGADSPGRADLAAWLTAGRTARGMTREHVARVTRIQLRTIERLEEARFDELPADVFVRGFIRNYALCVGISVDEALTRYAACGFAAAPVASASAQAQALLDTMSSLAPVASLGRTSSVVVVPSAPKILAAVAPAPAPASVALPLAAQLVALPEPASAKKGRAERDAKGRFVRKGTISQQQAAVDVDALGLSAEAAFVEDLEVEITVVEASAVSLELEPKLDSLGPPPAVRSPITERTVITVRPALTIDDDDPESAEREREDRATRSKDKDGGWRSFLPPALLDQDRGRQGGLTLAVIILLIVATLTLSYLMRRPSSTGEGVTQSRPLPAQLG